MPLNTDHARHASGEDAQPRRQKRANTGSTAAEPDAKRAALGDISNATTTTATAVVAAGNAPATAAGSAAPAPNCSSAAVAGNFPATSAAGGTEGASEENERPGNNNNNGRSRKRHQPVVHTKETSLALSQPEDLSLPADVVDVDSSDAGNPLMVTEYVREIFSNLLAKEDATLPIPGYMTLGHQGDINAQMRAILVDWLVEVAEEYQLASETLFLSVNLVDRYLSKVSILRGRLQLVGITCMLIASKYEEVYSPAVSDYVFITDNTYTRDDLLATESAVLSELGFGVTVPTAKVFLRRWVKCARANPRTTMYASYLCELSLQCYGLAGTKGSKVAAAAVLVARSTMGVAPAWSATLGAHTGYAESELADTARSLVELATNAPNDTLKAIFDKYSNSKFHRTALVPPVLPASCRI